MHTLDAFNPDLAMIFREIFWFFTQVEKLQLFHFSGFAQLCAHFLGDATFAALSALSLGDCLSVLVN